LNVKHRARDIALLEHVLIFMEFQYLLSRAHFGEKVFRVKHVLVWLLHGSPPLARRTSSHLIGASMQHFRLLLD
jgi:hypothetical protein